MSANLVRGVEELVGLSVWAVVAGSGTGSVINLLFGEAIRRSTPISNPTLPAKVRDHDASHSLFIRCVWRLDGESEVITGAWDDNQAGGPMLAGLTPLVGDRVKSVWLGRPAFDLDVLFESGKTLRVFCDQINSEDDNPNYSLLLPTVVHTVGCRSQLRESVRGPI